ncbi:LOW QUALITY PROTEIN: hypothetical protein V1477_017805 [Vespula maculifrons]|uniref:Uncharacterized protein n=1 Tax=Vespula maculifrons TaxID=7453 RepID=A0ABD2B0I3_VESMC
MGQRALYNDTNLDALKKNFFPLFPLNRYNSVLIGQIWTKKIWSRRTRRAPFTDRGPVALGGTRSETKIIWTKKIWPYRGRRNLSMDPGPVSLAALVSVQKKYGRMGRDEQLPMINPVRMLRIFFPLFTLNRYNSAPIGQISPKKIGSCRTRRAPSNEPCPVPLGAIVSAKKNFKVKIFFPLFPLNRYNSAPISRIWMQKICSIRARRALSYVPGLVVLDAIVSEIKIVKEKFLFPLFPLNRFNSIPIGQIWTKKIWACRTRRAPSNDPGPNTRGAIVSSIHIGQICTKKIWACRTRRGPSKEPGPDTLGAIVSAKKIIWTKKIWVCRKRRAPSKEPGPDTLGAIVSDATSPFQCTCPVPLGAIVSRKKIVKGKFLFPLFPLNRYNSTPIGQIWTKKIWAYRTRLAPSNEPCPVPQCVIGKIVKEKCFFPLFHLYRNYSAPIGPIAMKKIWPYRKNFFFLLFTLNRYTLVPIGQVWTKKIRACRSRGAPSNESGQVPLGAIIWTSKILACRSGRAPSNECGSVTLGAIVSTKKFPVAVGAIVSEKKIVIEKFFFPLFHLKHNYSAPIGQISMKKICPYRARRAPSKEPGPVPLLAIVSERKIVKEKFFFPLFHLNRNYSAPIGQISMKKIWPYRARRNLSNKPDPVHLGGTVSDTKIVKKKFFFLCSIETVITRFLLVRSGRKKYGRVGRDESFTLTPVSFL